MKSKLTCEGCSLPVYYKPAKKIFNAEGTDFIGLFHRQCWENYHAKDVARCKALNDIALGTEAKQ